MLFFEFTLLFTAKPFCRRICEQETPGQIGQSLK